ncbi:MULTISPECIES: TetR/AcrR family transcriptional regulator [unclassified Leeuwenhoekiella]|uniref:TetR/AcrR family transcriptional regulator n=1 Tax=unclassified Leeuwenhoekiella TaxID=2615029 RepID=UPI000C3777E6|nr:MULTISPECIES: TetR/AcrR family transcriptional regulator [unclassified Leeuwenhoekiella]MAW93622.1 TetR family transcriptional regulator [Leeuwenhoekiella sp.]MBA80365.1 TetR family transcriptional regulator [Leeuwenhoekiella sp.]|tara:strand:- start:10885 stop:11499 length:615 start_codon:yes stop_codon:yes gene_type:complete
MSKEYVGQGRTRQKQITRERILNSAQEFMQQGRDFTLEEVAEQAGVSRATIYRYFPNSEILAAESALNVNTESCESIYQYAKASTRKQTLLNIQDYFNRLALDHEPAFRKYLSVLLNTTELSENRGARRPKTLQLALDDAQLNLSKEDLKNLKNIASVLMGIEPMIVTKDVCGLDNEQSMKLLQWGFEMMLNAIINQNKKTADR